MFGFLKGIFSNKPETQNQSHHTTAPTIIAPIITDVHARGCDKEYRLPDDDINVYRIDQQQPEGCGRKIIEFVKIAGIQEGKREGAATKFIYGSERKLELRREPTNAYDPNAIAVYGHCIYNGANFSGQLGYIPAETAKNLVGVEPLKALIEIMYAPIGRKGPGIRISVWTEIASKKPKAPPAEVQPYKRGIEIPRYNQARVELATALADDGYIDNAIEIYEKVISGNYGDSHQPYYKLAEIYHKREKYEDEIRILRQGIKIFAKINENAPDYAGPKLRKMNKMINKATELLNQKLR